MSNTQDFNNTGVNDTDAQTTATANQTPDAGPVRSMRYWLRAVDTLIARELDVRFAEAGASRRDLRVLSLLASGEQLSEKKRARLERHSKRLWALADRGWITREAPNEEATSSTGWVLTDAGQAARTRLQQIAQDVQDRVDSSVSHADLMTTTDSLEAIAKELGWTEGMRIHRGGRRDGWANGRGHRRGYGHGRGHDLGGHRGHGHGHGHGRGHGHGHGTGHRGHGPAFGHGTGFDNGHRGGGQRSERHHGRGFERGFAAGFTAARSRG
ncbi:hypothetical protein U746_1014 [Mycolicibacterium mucogenicum 261Sha1.1M5]|uniref:hypothetical protein n=1 Tax=Leucobacter aridicollis TaxID=283878 RepID=UPI000F1F1F32|nr:hypothetical protein [Leucobacter aridicollis]MCS3429461.1 hypothetical protein [Leucobacter aridicollis]RKQ89772.1 hypothetical protein U746_1014 [Mycolicibacterium mucogenicum 261Sha1.1M5]